MNCNLIIKNIKQEKIVKARRGEKKGKLMHNYRCNNDRIMQTHTQKNNTHTYISLNGRNYNYG